MDILDSTNEKSSIKKTAKWVYYTCLICRKRKFIPAHRYKNEEEIACGPCTKKIGIVKQEPVLEKDIIKNDDDVEKIMGDDQACSSKEQNSKDDSTIY